MDSQTASQTFHTSVHAHQSIQSSRVAGLQVKISLAKTFKIRWNSLSFLAQGNHRNICEKQHECWQPQLFRKMVACFLFHFLARRWRRTFAHDYRRLAPLGSYRSYLVCMLVRSHANLCSTVSSALLSVRYLDLSEKSLVTRVCAGDGSLILSNMQVPCIARA